MNLTIQEDMTNIFLNSGFQEDVVYTPSGGTPRTIKAFVFREGSMDTNSGSRTGGLSNSTLNRYYKVEMLVSNESTIGIDNLTIYEDKITFPRRVGDSTNVTWLIKGIVEDDSGSLRIGLS